jgi:hypothetical protein
MEVSVKAAAADDARIVSVVLYGRDFSRDSLSYSCPRGRTPGAWHGKPTSLS